MIKVGTFFSGIGSPEQALINLGINHEIEFACDIDKYARQIYEKNFNCKNIYKDITKLNMIDLPPVDLLVFGFPCQSFSIAGRRGGFEDTRGTLFYDALRYLKEHKPNYFIAENVKGLVNHDKGKTLRTILDCLAKTENKQMMIYPYDNLGYNIYYKVLNTKDFGLPHNRERVFIVGIKDDVDFKFPEKKILTKKLNHFLQDSVDEKYNLSDKMISGFNKHKNRNKKLGNGFGWNPTEGDVVANCIDTKEGSRPQNNFIITHSLYPRSSKTGKRGTGHLTKKDGTVYCLDTSNNQAIETNNRIRKLTPIECERLQGFPDNHTEGVSNTQRYKQLGNTISVPVIESILKQLL